MLWPALTDPVHDSQRLFRQILQAMSEPGTLHELCAPCPPRDASIGPALWGALLTLCDLDTQLWIDPALDSPELRDALHFHTGCRLTQDATLADFALVTPDTLAREIDFAIGNDSYPDRGTTLLVAVEYLSDDGPWQFSGPGIETQRCLGVGNAHALMSRLSVNRSRFPCGLDAILACGTRLAAIPRSTRIVNRQQEDRACMSQ
ncbi:alpha-D-ribose 1-methylphosphonate 5-triphosphate synthase subunit PhnH [Modicisalibacter muralis]|uniref:Alpha-D-ribose 1-methylphosphonate 5-triphosphate synthase subunit PhnH n=1 Tax=Modicisalibacter muralis TaxID=119000 RepID=A0A1G9H1E5_9GAMM|nr:phosphonate C-P lyase system protein PhnH [Halomonas muralis]SDL06685.1 alpha-D-ribose 1-methylphosphonate 5-triphosphate synthase subunit PhnH [Halomonas muralis]